jgi:hypothetical protein
MAQSSLDTKMLIVFFVRQQEMATGASALRQPSVGRSSVGSPSFCASSRLHAPKRLLLPTNCQIFNNFIYYAIASIKTERSTSLPCARVPSKTRQLEPENLNRTRGHNADGSGRRSPQEHNTASRTNTSKLLRSLLIIYILSRLPAGRCCEASIWPRCSLLGWFRGSFGQFDCFRGPHSGVRHSFGDAEDALREESTEEGKGEVQALLGDVG